MNLASFCSRTRSAGAGLAPKFWPHAFYHFLRLHNVAVHRGRTESPHQICTGEKPNLKLLRTFGCRIYALPARTRRPAKALSDARVGIFLGYANTMKNALYCNLEHETIKTCQHVIFDEAMNDLEEKPPNARLLASLKPGAPDDVDLNVKFPDLEVSRQPFTEFVTVNAPLDLPDDRPIGFRLQTCTRLRRAFVSEIDRQRWNRSLQSVSKKTR